MSRRAVRNTINLPYYWLIPADVFAIRSTSSAAINILCMGRQSKLHSHIPTFGRRGRSRPVRIRLVSTVVDLGKQFPAVRCGGANQTRNIRSATNINPMSQVSIIHLGRFRHSLPRFGAVKTLKQRIPHVYGGQSSIYEMPGTGVGTIP